MAIGSSSSPSTPPGAPPWWNGRWESGEIRTLPDARPLPGHLACSPDGRAVVYSQAEGSRVRFVVRELDSGETRTLPVVGPVARMAWVHPPSPVLVSVTIENAPDSLSLGERRRLDVRLAGSDGNSRSDPVTWQSLDPGVISASAEGIVTANRPGTGRIVATAGLWRADTVWVAVGGEAEGPDLLAQDHFAELDSLRWELVGFPHPHPVTLEDGGPALRIPGDGQHRDGIRSREGFSLERGLTVELSVRLPLTRPDRQSVDLMLLGPVSPGAGTPPMGALESAVVVAYPGRELERFDPRVLSLTIHRYGFLLPLPPEAEPGEWMRLALEVQPDGQVSVRVNGALAGAAPLHLEIRQDERWLLQVSGASVDTELVVRDLVVWRGVR